MTNTNLKHLKLSLVCAFTGILMTANFAIAQQADEEIVVKSPVERTGTRIPIGSSVSTETIELNRYVSFDDLDLTKTEDIEKLDARINDTARESCQKLSEMFPLDRSDLTEVNRCMEKAIAYANKQKEKLITAGP